METLRTIRQELYALLSTPESRAGHEKEYSALREDEKEELYTGLGFEFDIRNILTILESDPEFENVDMAQLRRRLLTAFNESNPKQRHSQRVLDAIQAAERYLALEKDQWGLKDKLSVVFRAYLNQIQD